MALLFRPPCIEPPERQLPFFAALRATIDNPMEGWPRAVYEQPIYVPPRRDFRTVFVCSPEALKTVLLDRVEDFPKSPLSQRLLQPMLGRGLATADLSEWRWQRRAAAPAFQNHYVDQSAPAISRLSEEMLGEWRRRPADRPLDMTQEMMRLSFDILLETMFGGRERFEGEKMRACFSAYLRGLGRPSIADLVGAPLWIRTICSPASARAICYMQNAVDKLIAERRLSPPRGDLIDLLLNARDRVTGRAMSQRELRDNLLTFLAAGHETTALAIVWSLFLLSQCPEMEERARAEISSIAGDGAIDANVCERLVLTRAIVQEALRLYPPFPVLSRIARQECELGGERLARGDIVVVPIYALHRHRLYWDNPNAFDPERFLREPGKNRFVYMPFGAGPRVCIGASLAIREAVIALASLIRAAHFECLNAEPRALLRITMRPEGGLPMRVCWRSSNPKARGLEAGRPDTERTAPQPRKSQPPVNAASAATSMFDTP